jgi:hypothetical protein
VPWVCPPQIRGCCSADSVEPDGSPSNKAAYLELMSPKRLAELVVIFEVGAWALRGLEWTPIR